ncbi:hypothetical protein C9J85_08960 [Haloferax sp. wsp5]|nr:hypothetical protein C9J85_08960 [Haloferax sp. wsp5]
MSRSTSDSVTVDVEPKSQSSRTVREQIRRRLERLGLVSLPPPRGGVESDSRRRNRPDPATKAMNQYVASVTGAITGLAL